MINSFTINLDRLDLQLAPISKKVHNFFDVYALTPATAKDEYQHAGFTLTRRKKVTGNYLLQYDVSRGGYKFGSIRLHPTSPKSFFNGKPLTHLQVAKPLLYSQHLQQYTTEFLAAFYLKINNIAYYEIALDTNQDFPCLFGKFFADERFWFMSRDRTVEKVLKISTVYRDPNTKELTSYYVGEVGNIRVVTYNKTKANNKGVGYESFIREFHAANGLDVSADVYRIEVRVPRSAFKFYRAVYVRGTEQLSEAKYYKLSEREQGTYTRKMLHRTREITLADLTNPTELLRLFRFDFTNLVDFRQKGPKQKHKCKRINLIDFKKVADFKLTEKIEDIDMQNCKTIEKGEVKNLLSLHKKYGKGYLADATEIAAEHGLMDYLEQQQQRMRLPVTLSNPDPLADLFRLQ